MHMIQIRISKGEITMGYHILAFTAGFLLDQLAGDPSWLPHPIRFIGWLIRRTEGTLRRRGGDEKAQRRQGGWLCVIVIGLTTLLAAAILLVAYALHPWLGRLVESVMTYQLLACKCLRVESMKVAEALHRKDLPEARRAVSMIVGRDTESLDAGGVAKAAIETVAENTSDGVIAPMLYTAVGGPVLGFAYKAINTLDSTVGYKNERYLHFGRRAAKLDDLVNFLSARISGIGMICSAFLLGKDFSGPNAWKIFRRDRFCHASPNSAQTESACAGALEIQLAGDAKYFGKVVNKPFIGDKTREVTEKDIKNANKLMYVTAWLCWGICLGLLRTAAEIVAELL